MPYRLLEPESLTSTEKSPRRFRILKEEPPQESLGSNVGRQVGRTGARVAETVLGAPRAFGEFLQSVVPEKALKAGAEKIGLGGVTENLLENTKRFAPYKLFPKSEDIRKNVTQGLFGEKLEPKNEWEKKSDELFSDFAALAIPFGGQVKLLKPAMLALGGTLASEGVGQLGGSEKQKGYAKLGTILFGSLINPKAAENLTRNLYKQAENARPADAVVNASNLEKSAITFENQLLKGDPSASSKKKSLSLIKDINSKVKNGNIEIQELEQFKRDINEARSALYDEFKADKVGRKAAKRNLDTVSNIIDKSLKEYGKVNPEWEAFYRPANEAYGAMAQSKKARNTITRVAKKYGIHGVLPLLGLGHFGGAAAIGTAATTAATGGGILLGAEIAVKMAKSKTLRNHYKNLINSALKEDVVLVHENLEKIRDELERD